MIGLKEEASVHSSQRNSRGHSGNSPGWSCLPPVPAACPQASHVFHSFHHPKVAPTGASKLAYRGLHSRPGDVPRCRFRASLPTYSPKSPMPFLWRCLLFVDLPFPDSNCGAP